MGGAYLMTSENQWNSKTKFIFSILAATLGMGSIWRLSYVIYSTGGGSFFIPYIIAIFVMGIPFLILEYGLGYSFRDSFTNVIDKINPKFEIIPWMILFSIFFVMMYYVVIIGWDIVYLVSSINFAWGSNPANFFVFNVGGSSDLSDSFYFLIPTVISIILIWVTVFIFSFKNLNEGMGKFSLVSVPLLLISIVIIVLYSVTLPGAEIGIAELLTPDWNMLLNVNIWIAAFTQIIFSLDVGMGIGITFSSYLPEGSKLTDYVFLVVGVNSLFELFSTVGVFSILGFMSFKSGIPIVQLVSEKTSLMFVVFPMIFNAMGEVGHIIAPMLFLAILFAGIGSSIGGMAPIIDSIMIKLNAKRSKVVAGVCAFGFLGSLIFTTNIGCYILSIVDIFTNQLVLLILIAIQCVLFTWDFDVNSLIPVLNENSTIKVGKFWKDIVKYALPIVLVFIWVTGNVSLYEGVNSFELVANIILAMILISVSVIFTKIKSPNSKH